MIRLLPPGMRGPSRVTGGRAQTVARAAGWGCREPALTSVSQVEVQGFSVFPEDE